MLTREIVTVEIVTERFPRNIERMIDGLK